MNQIQAQQKILNKTARSLPWEREVKAWDWKKFLQKKPRRLYTAKDIAAAVTHLDGSHGAVSIHNIEDEKAAVHKRVAWLLQNQGKHTKKSVLMQQGYAKSQVVLRIKPRATVQLDFTNMLFQHWAMLYIVVGAGAVVHVIDTHDSGNAVFGAGSVFVDCQAGARVQYHIKAQKKSSYQSHYVFALAKNAHLSLLQALSPGSTQLHTNHVLHTGAHTTTNHTWILDAKKHTQLYGNIVNYHRAPHTTADVVLKAVGRDQARVVIDGWIDIAKRAFETNSYLQQDVLLVSEKATVKAVPNLEILNNDVVASHGATIGMLDETQLQYIKSRGVAQQQAERMLTDGFMQSARERFMSKY